MLKPPAKKIARNKTFLSLIIIIAITFSVFYSSLHNLILNWDDQWQVCNAFTEGGFGLQNISSFLFNKYKDQYSPLNQLIYIIIYKIDGYNPFYFHFFSLIFHISNTCLIFIIIKRIITKTSIIENATSITMVSFFTAIIFAIHPMQVESVSWISASKVIYFSFFYLLATLGFMKYIDTRKKIYYLTSLLLFILSFLCKEQALTFPIWLILLIFIYDNSVTPTVGKILKYTLPFFVLALVFGLYFMYFISISSAEIMTAHYPLWKRIIFSFKAIFLLLKKFILPIDLYYFYPLTNKIDYPFPLIDLFYPFFFACIIPIFIYRKSIVLLLSLTYFIIHIVLMIHVLPLPRETITADRYIYLALPGLSFLLSYFLYKACIRLKKYKIIILCFMFTATVFMGILSFNYTKKWHDPESLRKATEIDFFQALAK